MSLRTHILPALAVALYALPAFGDETPRLRADVTVSGALVTLGDLIHGAGAAAGAAVFRAPELGTAGTVRVDRVVAVALNHGLTDLDTAGIAAVTVSRLGRTIEDDEISRAIGRHLVETGKAGTFENVDIALDRVGEPLVVERSAVEPVTVDSLDYDPRTGRFAAVVRIADSTAGSAGRRVAGHAVEIVEVPVLARTLERGEIVSPRDIVIDRLPRSTVRPEAITEIERLSGMSARRQLRAGTPLTADQLMEPILVQRGEMVTIVYSMPGLTLTTRGRALAAGARGEFLTIHNLQSKRTIEAEVTGPGVVTVMPPRVPVAALTPTAR